MASPSFPPKPASDALAPWTPPPAFELRVVRDRSEQSGATGGFVDLKRVDLVAKDAHGVESDAFSYDAATRAGIDAIVIIAFRRALGARRVYLRSAVRVPIALRSGMTPTDYNLWEVPAGIIEPGEEPRAAAARELTEELGFDVDASRLIALGPPSWPAPGLIAERHFYFAVDVTDDTPGAPAGDGSPLEHGATIMDVGLEELLARCRRGELPDAKSELALRRFAELT